MRLLLIGCEVATVVGRTLLVAERLEAFLQVALERLVELVRLHLERLFVRVLTAADDALAQREEELPDAFLAVLRLDELEHGVAEVVDKARVAAVAVPLQVAHLRHDVGDRRVANHHEVERHPLAALVVRQTFVHPERYAPPNEPLRNDVELEDVRQLVRDEPVQSIRWIIDRQQHAVAVRFRERADPLGRNAGRDVLLLELAVRLEQDERNLEGQVVLQVSTDLLVRPLRVAGHPLQMLLDIRVVVDLEVIGRVDVPVEVVVVDVVLAKIRHERRLGRSLRRGSGHHQDNRQGEGSQRASVGRPARGDTHAHMQYLEGAVQKLRRSYCDVSRACKPWSRQKT